MKQFDKKFSRSAKEAFDNYNADHLAGEGWKAFTGKYGRKRKRAIVFPLWAKAASVAVLVTLGVLFTARITDRKVGESVSQTAKESRSRSTEPEANMEDTGTVNPVTPATKPVTPSAVPVIANPVQAAEVSPLMNLQDNPVELRLTEDADAGLKLKPGTVLKGIIDLPREKMTTTIMTGLSGMMASINNTESVAQGFSLGFYVEQQLTRRISVRPGLAMAKHNYALEGIPGGSVAFDYAAPELNGVSGTTTSYEADVEVLSMEVPVNFVFSLRKRSGSNLFVTTGASTVIYLNQNLSGNLNNTYTRATVDSSTGEVSYESKNTSVTIESRRETLSRVDFLGLANFSAGYSFPFAGSSHFVFEPFIQMPVKDLTTMNLRIRYGGISMKLQF